MAVRQPTIEHPARKARADAQAGRGWYAALARTGLVAKGVSFGIVGILAIKLALGEGGKATSREGALQSLAGHGFGKVLLVGLAAGFAAYAAWRLVQAFAERGDDAGTWGARAGYVGRAVIYAALAVGAIKVFVGNESESQSERAHETTALLLSWPAGTWIVGILGALIVGVGLWNAYRGITRKFEDKWRTGQMTAAARTWGGRAGVAGHLARGVVFSLIGFFVVKAALEFDPKEAIGWDGALRKLAAADYGPYLLGATAAGVICYGLYCFVDARYRDVSSD
jgi:Domain of Unknown Function (DUF1206)